MKIGYFNYLYDIKKSSVGASVHVEQLANALRNSGDEVDVYYLNRFTSVEASVQSSYRGFLKKKLWRYLNQVNALVSNLSYFVKEWKIISKNKPDVILLRYNFLNVSLPLIAWLKRIPLILEVNAPMAYENKKFSDHAVKLPLIPEFIEWLNITISRRVIVVSSQLKEYYKKWSVSKEKIVVIPNGADSIKFHPRTDGSKIISQFDLKGKIVLGFIGSFHYWHGLENLEGFIKSVILEYRNSAFLLVGEGPLKSKLEELFSAEEYEGRVFFSGYVPHEKIPEYVAAMDIVLAPYPKLEFFYYSPLKLYEYMSAGRAVVASSIGQIAEVIVDKENGILYEPGDFSDMLTKTKLLIEDKKLRNKVGVNARELIENKYNWNTTAKKVRETLTCSG